MSSVTKTILIGCTALIILGFILEKPNAAIDPESIVGMWTFEEGEGEDVKDISGNGNDGTFFVKRFWDRNPNNNNALERPFDKNLVKPKWVDGKFGTALNFRGIVGGPDDWGVVHDRGAGVVHIPKFSLVAPAKDATITFWTKLGDIDPAEYDCDILSFEPLGYPRLNIHFPWENKVMWSHGLQRHSAGEIPKETLGNWEFWAFVRSTAENYMRVLRNMEELSIKEDVPADPPHVANNAHWFRLNGDAPWSIGGRGGSPYKGIIDEVGVFDAVLSDEVLTDIMKNGLEETAFAVDTPFAVDPTQKLTTTWGQIKEKD